MVFKRESLILTSRSAKRGGTEGGDAAVYEVVGSIITHGDHRIFEVASADLSGD